VRQIEAPHGLFHRFSNWGELLEGGGHLPAAVLDKALIRQRFAKHLESYRRLAAVQRQIAASLAEKWEGIFHGNDGRAPRLSRVLEAGCGTGFFTRECVRRMDVERLFLNDLVEEALPVLREHLKRGIFSETAFSKQDTIAQSPVYQPPGVIELLPGDAETVPLPADLDAVVSASTLQWFADVPRFFGRVAGALRDGGWLVFSTFGPENLHEIRALTGRGLCYPDLERLRGWLAERHFEIAALEEERLEQAFARPRDVLRHLQQTGVTGTGEDSFRWTPGSLRAFERDYAARYGRDRQVVLTWHAIYAVCKKQETK
jgi:malonyl-ACP O-methyltransferase BioC